VKAQRRRFLIDRSVQLGLLSRLVFHWLMLLSTTAVALPLFRTVLLGDVTTPLVKRSQDAALDAGVLLVVFVLLLPYFIYDSLKTTNRFSGPVYRLRRTMQAIASGARFQPLQLRQGDYWHDLAADFNHMVERLQEDNASAVNEAKASELEAIAAS
jgi:hypothetical protein